MSDEDQPLRSVEEIAAELGVGSKRVRAAVKKLRGRIGTQPGERNGKRDGRVRLYGAEARAAIRQQVAQDQVRRQLVGEQGVAYWRALASLRVAGLAAHLREEPVRDLAESGLPEEHERLARFAGRMAGRLAALARTVEGQKPVRQTSSTLLGETG